MSITNLGQFGQPQASPVSGLSEAIARGSEAGVNQRRTDIMQQGADTASREAGTRAKSAESDAQYKQDSLKVQLAESIRKGSEKDREYAYKLLQDTSMALTDKKPGELKMFWDSEQGKSIGTVVKAHLKDYWNDETKRPLLLNKAQVVSDKLNTVKLDLVNKMGSGATLSAGEERQLDFFKQYSPQMIGAAVQAASNNLSWSTMEPQQQADEVRKQLNMMKDIRRNMFETGLEKGDGSGGAAGGQDEVSAESWLSNIGAGI